MRRIQTPHYLTAGLHVLEQAWKLFGKTYLGSRLEDILVKSEIFGPNAVNQIMKGKNFKRCSLAHMLTYETMCRLKFTAFLKWMVDKEQMSELVAEELEVSCKNIQQAMKSFVLEERTQEKKQTVKENVTKLEQHLTSTFQSTLKNSLTKEKQQITPFTFGMITLKILNSGLHCFRETSRLRETSSMLLSSICLCI